LSAIQWSDQNLWPFSDDTQVRATRHPRHRVAIPSLPQGKILVEKFERDPKVGSKVLARLRQYSSIGNQTSSSLNSHSIATPSKTPSGKI
jgi:hypothetical protein